MKKFFQILFLIVFTVAVTAMAVYFYNEHVNGSLNNVKVNIARSDENGFVDKDYVFGIIKKYLPDSVKIKNVHKEIIEDELLRNPWISEADVFVTIEGDLMVNIHEAEPFLRVFPKGKTGFYLDKEGNIIPLSKNYAPRVKVANGYFRFNKIKGYENIFDTVYRTGVLKDVLALALKVDEYPFVKALAGEYYYNSKGEFNIVPLFGTDVINLGKLDNVDEKLTNLTLFYKKALVYEGWNKYKEVNLKYKNQIVCTKN